MKRGFKDLEKDLGVVKHREETYSGPVGNKLKRYYFIFQKEVLDRTDVLLYLLQTGFVLHSGNWKFMVHNIKVTKMNVSWILILEGVNVLHSVPKNSIYLGGFTGTRDMFSAMTKVTSTSKIEGSRYEVCIHPLEQEKEKETLDKVLKVLISTRPVYMVVYHGEKNEYFKITNFSIQKDTILKDKPYLSIEYKMNK